jgi:hypothetical protein
MDIINDHHQHLDQEHPLLTTEGQKLFSILEKKSELPTSIESKINKIWDDFLHKTCKTTKENLIKELQLQLQAKLIQRKKKIAAAASSSGS